MPPGVVIFEDPPAAHRPPRPALAGVHAQEDAGAGAEGSRLLRPAPSTRSWARGASTSSPTSARRCRCERSGCCSASPSPIRRRPATAPTRRCAPTRANHGREHMTIGQGDFFADYLDWRTANPVRRPHDRVVVRRVRRRDRHTRRLTRDEVLIYVAVLSGAGNETTNRLIGWMGKVLAEHPDQRRELVEDRSLVPNADRGAPPVRAAHAPRRPLRDSRRRVPRHTVPAGSAMIASAGPRTVTTESTRTPTASTSTARSAST